MQSAVYSSSHVGAQEFSAEHDRRLSARERILRLLRARGPAGATNLELNAICFRFGGRLFELRRRGHTIRTENRGSGVFLFVLECESLFDSIDSSR